MQLIYFSDRMAEMIKNVKDFETTSTVEDTCFISIPEKNIKLENSEIQGKVMIRAPRFVINLLQNYVQSFKHEHFIRIFDKLF